MDSHPVILMRHGETIFNLEGRYQGQCDSPLTERGIEQANAVSKMLAVYLGDKPVQVITSSLGRAKQTADILAGALGNCLDLKTDGRISEVGMGAWDGLTRREIAERWPDARRGRSKREWFFHGPGGESLADVISRVRSAMSDYNSKPDAVQILVSHAVTGRIIRALHSNQPVLEVLKLEAPQDAAFLLSQNGMVELLASEYYIRRQADAS